MGQALPGSVAPQTVADGPSGEEASVVYLLAAAGGALGALARAAVAELLPRVGGGWPWATLLVNLLGCLLLGVLLAVLAVRRPAGPLLQVFLGTGVLGGFTTYSAFAVEAVELVASGRPAVAAGYVTVSVLGGVLAVAAGARAGRSLAER
jgi:fluoride exporter